MSIKNKIYKEQIVLNEEWLRRKKIGLIKYIVYGSIKCFILIGTTMLICGLMNHQFSYNQIVATIISSIIIPILSWYGNELRLKFIK